MFDIYLCIRDGHDLRLVLLAALICLLSSLTALLLLRQAKRCEGAVRRRWWTMAGASAGFGIWATHFVAMLGYVPGMIVGYSPALTLVSLVIPIMTTGLAFALTLGKPGRRTVAFASAICGSGIAAMHYTGMLAMELPAAPHWNTGYVAASVALAILPLYPR